MSLDKIVITCGDKFHEAGPLTLYTFAYERHRPRGRFPNVPNMFREGWTDESVISPDKREPSLFRTRRSPAISLDEHDRPQGIDDGPMGRERYNLSCGDQNLGCRDAVVVRRETLDPILDTLSQHGVASITLQALRARIVST